MGNKKKTRASQPIPKVFEDYMTLGNVTQMANVTRLWQQQW